MDITSKQWLNDMRIRHRADYEIEKELADALRATPAADRGKAYSATYEELFRRLPDHPFLISDPAQSRRASADRLRFVKGLGADTSTKATAILELGSGDGEFCRAASHAFERVIGSDFSHRITEIGDLPPNVETFVIDGMPFPLEDGSVDVAYSDQLIQKLDPDDAIGHLAEVRRVVRRTGRYICVTPNKASGPHDISVFYDEVSQGVHLREYRSAELAALLHDAGFERVRFYLGGRGRYVPIPLGVASALEALFARLPRAIRSRLTESKLVLNMYPLLGINAVADNPNG
jgi:SAM-dependent methyltransferase